MAAALFLAVAVEAADPPLAPGQLLPAFSGDNLAGLAVTLPGAARGKVALIAFGFSYDSRTPVEAWTEHVRAAWGAEAGFNWYHVPMIGGFGRLAKPFTRVSRADRSRRRGPLATRGPVRCRLRGGIGQPGSLAAGLRTRCACCARFAPSACLAPGSLWPAEQSRAGRRRPGCPAGREPVPPSPRPANARSRLSGEHRPADEARGAVVRSARHPRFGQQTGAHLRIRDQRLLRQDEISGSRCGPAR